MTVRIRLLSLLFLIGSLCGCSTLYKDVFPYEKPEFVDSKTFVRGHYILGIVAENHSNTVGARVVSVLRESPAEFAGILPGDVIVGFNQSAVATTSELATYATNVNSSLKYQVTLAVIRANSKKIRRIKVKMEKMVYYATTANKGIRVHKDDTHLPFLFTSAEYKVDVLDYKAYTGVDLECAGIIYSRFGLLPIFSFALYQAESLEIFADAGRYKLLHWPLILNTGDKASDPETVKRLHEFDKKYTRL